MNNRTSICLVASAAILLAAACGNDDPQFGDSADDRDEVAAQPGPGSGQSQNVNQANPNACPPVLDFDTDDMGVPLAAGTVVQNQFQSQGILSIDCANGNSNHPDTCIIFDSSSPTGGDVDLGTPNQDFGGPGIGNGGKLGQLGQNDVALGNLLIIAENVTDSNNDGLIDDPDDEGSGGVITFTFDGPTEVSSVTLVDIDANEPGIVEVTFDGGGSMSVPFQLLGDNSVQTIALNQNNVVSMGVHLCLSGAVAAVDYCPEPDPCITDTDCIDSAECINGTCLPKPATASGMVFYDVDKNDVFSTPDAPFGGIEVRLYVDADADNMPDNPAMPACNGDSNCTMSDAMGQYSFNAINAYGTYVIGFQNLTGYDYVAKHAGSNTAIDSDVNNSGPNAGYTDSFATVAAQMFSDVSCGYKSVGGGI